MLADVNGDGRADIVGFGEEFVEVALSTGSGFAARQQRRLDHRAVADFEIVQEFARPRPAFLGGQAGKIDPNKIPELRPAFGKDGVLTAASSSKISDGAAALVVMSATRRGLLQQYRNRSASAGSSLNIPENCPRRPCRPRGSGCPCSGHSPPRPDPRPPAPPPAPARSPAPQDPQPPRQPDREHQKKKTCRQ